MIATILEIEVRTFFVTTIIIDELSSFDRDDHMARDLPMTEASFAPIFTSKLMRNE